MLTAADVELIRARFQDTHWDRQTAPETWRVVRESADGLSVLVLVGVQSRDQSAGKFGAHAKDLPWSQRTTYTPWVLDRDRRTLHPAPDHRMEDYFAEHVQALARGRRLAEIKRRRSGGECP